ncbi:hypothetical protein GBA52_010288 [Prunus armeniaca]|nr:hypothetical protein GBA52_010288 [Prunus armeniaca]
MTTATTINDLPDAILSTIIGIVSDTRTRNSLSLACRKFRSTERGHAHLPSHSGETRATSPTSRSASPPSPTSTSPSSLRGATLCSPPPPPPPTDTDPLLLAQRLRAAFPFVDSLIVYSRSPSTVQIVSHLWPGLRRVQACPMASTATIAPWRRLRSSLRPCHHLTSWTCRNSTTGREDLPPGPRGPPRTWPDLSPSWIS